MTTVSSSVHCFQVINPYNPQKHTPHYPDTPLFGSGPTPPLPSKVLNMVVGNLLTMPLIVINLGGEMIYILQQRLSAQNVAKTRGRKVLQDVLRTMYSKSFVSELFKPQDMYSNSSTRQIFNKLAHSSIMRINETR